MSVDDDIRNHISKAFEAYDVKMGTKNLSIAEMLDKKIRAGGQLTNTYKKFAKFDQPVSLALLMALTDFLVSKKEFQTAFKEIMTALED
jgi:hypothetical protein